REGELGPGERLPTIRAMAKQLDLSPTTISAAWAQLARRGIIHTAGRRGTTVADVYAGTTRYRRALASTGRLYATDLATGIPDPALLPNLEQAVSDLANTTPSGYLDAPAIPQLIEKLRGDWPYPAEKFMIMDGAMSALSIAIRTLIRTGDRVIVEDPGFPLLIDALEAAGAQIIGIRSDDQGMLARPLAEALSYPAAAIFLQPRAQNPTGVSLTSKRACQLADVIRCSSAMLIEDDSTGAIASSPALSLGHWLPKQAIHVRSFSKSHGPDLRIAAMSGPADIIDEMTAKRRLGQGWTSRLLQRVLLSLLSNPQALATVAHARE